ncbi:MAG: cell division protein FtsQ/DivIB [Desulfobacterales bacterium]
MQRTSRTPRLRLPNSSPVRRTTIRRKNRRRGQALTWLKTGFYAIGFVLVLAGLNAGFLFCYNAATSWNLFTARVVAVEGNRRISTETIRHQAGVENGANLMAVNLAQARKRLLAHPWIAEAEIAREIPDRIRIRVRERDCLAVVDLGRRFLIDGDGAVFAESYGDGFSDLPLIRGLEYTDLDLGDGPGSLVYQAILNVLALGRSGRAGIDNRRILEIQADRDRGLTLYLRPGNGIPRFQEVFLGYGEFREKLDALGALPARLEALGAATVYRMVNLDNGSRTIVQPAEDGMS